MHTGGHKKPYAMAGLRYSLHILTLHLLIWRMFYLSENMQSKVAWRFILIWLFRYMGMILSLLIHNQNKKIIENCQSHNIILSLCITTMKTRCNVYVALEVQGMCHRVHCPMYLQLKDHLVHDLNLFFLFLIFPFVGDNTSA